MTHIGYQAENGIAIITIRTPSFQQEMCRELRAAWLQADADPSVRAIVLTGTGKAFCVGADLKELQAGTPSLIDIAIPGSGFFTDKPIVGAINGYAIGAGLGLACSCDIRVASEKATFSFPEVNVGFMGGGLELITAMSPAVATELILTGEPISAQTALQSGFLNRVTPPEALLATALDYADRLKRKAPLTLRMAKRSIYRHRSTYLQDYKLSYYELIWPQLNSADIREGAAAILEKRPPVFEGK